VNLVSGIRQLSGILVARKEGNVVGVLVGYENVASIGCNGKISWTFPSGGKLLHKVKRSVFPDGEAGNVVGGAPVGSV
jgi:hypothetical protein